MKKLLVLISFCLSSLVFGNYDVLMMNKYGAKRCSDEGLLAVYEAICKEIDVNPIPLYVVDLDLFNIYGNIRAHYQPAEKLICLFPTFFNQGHSTKVKILLHELRHHMQYTKSTRISDETGGFAKQYDTQFAIDAWNDTGGSSRTRKLEEFDADTFALSHFSCVDCLLEIRDACGWSNVSGGYLMKKDYVHYTYKAEKEERCCQGHQQKEEGEMSEYLPSGVLAIYNDMKKQKKEKLWKCFYCEILDNYKQKAYEKKQVKDRLLTLLVFDNIYS